jgi:hypothetical protein
MAKTLYTASIYNPKPPKKTSIGRSPSVSMMNKKKRSSFKAYRGQGK